MQMKKEKIFFIYLRTGGGHLAPARSVVNYLNKKYPGKYELELINAFEKTNPIPKYILEDGYRILQSQAQWYYEFLYLLNKLPLIARWNRFLASISSIKYLEKRILNEKPDKIVVFHFFSYKPIYKILAKHNLDIPVIIGVTDPFTAHPLWFMNKKQNFIVFSERLKQHCLGLGIDEKAIRVFPFILDEKFSNPLPETDIPAIKQKLGFPADKKLLLILGGGDGMPKGQAILKKLIDENFAHSIAIVCGKNKSLYAGCEELVEASGRKDIKVFAYVDFVYELINCSDAVVSKCGASTFMEILMTGKVPVVIEYLWEQEKGNMEYIVENEMGIYQKDITMMVESVKRLYSDENYYKAFTGKIKNAALKSGTGDVAEFIIQPGPFLQ